MNEIHIEITSYNILQILFVLALVFLVFGTIIYVSICGSENHRNELGSDNKNLGNSYSFVSEN